MTEFEKGRAAGLAEAAEAIKHMSHEDGLGMGSSRMESFIKAQAPLPPTLAIVSLDAISNVLHLVWAEGRRTQRVHHTADFVAFYKLLGITAPGECFEDTLP